MIWSSEGEDDYLQPDRLQYSHQQEADLCAESHSTSEHENPREPEPRQRQRMISYLIQSQSQMTFGCISWIRNGTETREVVQPESLRKAKEVGGFHAQKGHHYSNVMREQSVK